MKKLILILGFIPAIGFSAVSDEMQIQMNKELETSGLPIAGSGIQVVPNGKIDMPEWERQKFKAQIKERNSKGYVEHSSMRAHELIHFKEVVKKNGYSENLSTNEGDTGLHKKHTDIAFSYSFIGVPESEIKELYGIAPVGAFLTSPQRGWTGAVTFFNAEFANCAYTEKNMAPGQGAVQVEEAVARHDIHDKLTTIDVEGSKNTGFLYDISWFDLNYYHQLECATNLYSKDFLNKTIELAKKIDKN